MSWCVVDDSNELARASGMTSTQPVVVRDNLTYDEATLLAQQLNDEVQMNLYFVAISGASVMEDSYE